MRSHSSDNGYSINSFYGKDDYRGCHHGTEKYGEERTVYKFKPEEIFEYMPLVTPALYEPDELKL